MARVRRSWFAVMGMTPASQREVGPRTTVLGPGWSTTANTPFRRHKTWVHEGGISTPLIVHWPAGIQARGEIRHNPGHVIDIVPTVLEVTGGKPLGVHRGVPVPAAPGRSLAPVFSKDNTVPHDYLWWLHEGHRAIQVRNWKLVMDGKAEVWELYDLSKDRAESTDLAAQQPEKVRQLADLWQQRLDEFRELATQQRVRALISAGMETYESCRRANQNEALRVDGLS